MQEDSAVGISTALYAFGAFAWRRTITKPCCIKECQQVCVHCQTAKPAAVTYGSYDEHTNAAAHTAGVGLA